MYVHAKTCLDTLHILTKLRHPFVDGGSIMLNKQNEIVVTIKPKGNEHTA
jgi:hypothetical protein